MNGYWMTDNKGNGIWIDETNGGRTKPKHNLEK